MLELSTPARSVLGPDLPLIDDGVTVEQLLAHRSGIGDYLDEEAGTEVADYVMPVPVHELASTEDYLAVLDGYPSKFAPGERFAYSNGGYVILALIAERTSGASFPELVAQRVCRPAGMMDTELRRASRADRAPPRRMRWRVADERLPSPGEGQRRRWNLLDGGRHPRSVARVRSRFGSSRPSGLRRCCARAASCQDSRCATAWAFGCTPRPTPSSWRLRRRGLVPFAARSPRTRDGDGDLEHD